MLLTGEGTAVRFDTLLCLLYVEVYCTLELQTTTRVAMLTKMVAQKSDIKFISEKNYKKLSR